MQFQKRAACRYPCLLFMGRDLGCPAWQDMIPGCLGAQRLEWGAHTQCHMSCTLQKVGCLEYWKNRAVLTCSAWPACLVLGDPFPSPQGPQFRRLWQLGRALAVGIPVCRCVRTFQVNQHFKEGETPKGSEQAGAPLDTGSCKIRILRTWPLPLPGGVEAP